MTDFDAAAWARDNDPYRDLIGATPLGEDPPERPSGEQVAADPDPDGEYERQAAHARRVAARLADLEADRDARQQLAQKHAGPRRPLTDDAGTLDEILRRPPTQWRIGELLPQYGRALLVAQRKTGKTTMLGNLARAVLTGEDFLGRFPTRQLDGRVVLLNYEVSGEQLATWLHEMGVPADGAYLVNLRGRLNPLSDDAGCAELADLIRAQDGALLIVDPFGRAFTGRSQNDAADVAPFLARLDTVAAEAGCHELIMAAHAGWGADHARGSSSLEDWPDTIVTVTRDDEQSRFFTADGRDVHVDEDRLAFDPHTRSLSLSGDGSRKVVRRDRHLDELVDGLVAVVAEHPGENIGQLEDRLRAAGYTFQRGDVGQASQRAENRHRVTVKDGPRRSRLHFPFSLVPTSPDYSQDSATTSPDPSYRGGSSRGPVRGDETGTSPGRRKNNGEGSAGVCLCGEPHATAAQSAALGGFVCSRCGNPVPAVPA